MLLSDRSIVEAVECGWVGVTPWAPELVQPASLDVRLGDCLLAFDEYGIKVQNWSFEKWVLNPGEFVLGSTVEKVALPDDIAARFEGKSSLGRIGLMTHVTAGFIDPGFVGTITLELKNISNGFIVLEPGQLIGQLCFEKLDRPCLKPYGSPGLGSHYQGQSGPTPAA